MADQQTHYGPNTAPQACCGIISPSTTQMPLQRHYSLQHRSRHNRADPVTDRMESLFLKNQLKTHTSSPGNVLRSKGNYSFYSIGTSNDVITLNSNIATYDIQDDLKDEDFSRNNDTKEVGVNVFSGLDFYTNSSLLDPDSDFNESSDGNQSLPVQYNLPRLSAELQIAFYSIIFFLALVGNLLIIITLIQNKRMRTVTNVFLLNLALSDMLLALVCMPFTLVPVLLMDFIFGKFMCIFIRYLQAVSVGVSCFTLVAISLERYFAICRPLHSRSWQTLSHAYRCIVVCWVLAAALMTPTAVFQKHIEIGNGAHMCREIWPNQRIEQAYTVLLDLTLLVLPVIIMSVAYSRVVHALIFDVRSSLDLGVASNGQNSYVLQNYRTIELRLLNKDSCRSVSSYTSTDTTFSGSITPPKNISRSGTMTTPPTGRKSRRSMTHRIRHSNPTKIRQNKMRVIRMLFVVVLEFFICWTPVYLLQTWMVFHEESAYQVFTPLSKTLFHLLSYVSSCCNPITYCFMNKKFREAFLRVFQCRAPPQSIRERRMQQLHMKQLQSNREQKRRSTAVSRLSERFNPMASTTSSVLPLDSVRKNPIMERCKVLGKSVEEPDTGSGSD